MQGAVTLITMALPIIFSLLALIRVEYWRCTQHDKLHADRETVIQQTALLEEGQPLAISQDALQVSWILSCIFHVKIDALLTMLPALREDAPGSLHTASILHA